QLVEAVEGRRLDRTAAADVLARRWVEGGRLRLPATLDQPAVAPGELRRAFEEFAKPATSAPLSVVVGRRSVKVPVALFAPTLSLTAKGGRLQPVVDGAALRQALLKLEPQLESEARDATIDVQDGRVVTTASRPGVRIDPQQLAADVLPALTAPSRSATVRAQVQQPKVSSDDLKALGIVEQVSTFTTQFPFNPPRTTNIRLAAKTLDGTIVKPGETFSLNAALGQRTKEKGYQQAPVINGGRLTQDYGGGISQVSTTLFNAVFFAGLESVTHKPHSFYISRYPEGREATISWPTVDQKFRNDSGHGILIKTRVTDNAVTVSFYGTKVWDIEAVKGPRTNVKQPRTIRDTDGECVAQSPSEGFDVTVTRVFSRAGKQVRTERFFTRYIPEDHVICG
ncbi:MAG: VanW family protein, partial [Angustibacter sp.]